MIFKIFHKIIKDLLNLAVKVKLYVDKLFRINYFILTAYSRVLILFVWSCYQENPTAFKDYMLCDPGAYPEPPLRGKITFRITNPQTQSKTDEECIQFDKLQALMERIRKSVEARKRGEPELEEKDIFHERE